MKPSLGEMHMRLFLTKEKASSKEICSDIIMYEITAVADRETPAELIAKVYESFNETQLTNELRQLLSF